MSEPAPTPPVSLIEELDHLHGQMQLRDPMMLRFQRDIEMQDQIIRDAQFAAKQLRRNLSERRKYLREDAAVVLRKKHGIKTIPGFASKVESTARFYREVGRRRKDAVAEAARLSQELPAPTPGPAPEPPPSP